MNVAIAVPVLADGDAVGSDARGMATVLRGDGHRATFYSEKSLVSEETLPLAELMTANDDVLIYHHSHGCEQAVNAVLAFPGRAIVKYHNVTPPEYFPAGSEVQFAAETGLLQIAKLAKANVEIWCDSLFNGENLGGTVEVIPPFMQSDLLANAAIDPETAAAFDAAVTTILMVGRVAPNKNLLLALEAFAKYRETDPTARLVIAGGHVFEDYSAKLAETISKRGLKQNVIITGRVTVSQLKTLYTSADVLLVTSEHEGFCVPLVEAMRLGVPVVAVARTAIPETAGDAAVLVNADPLKLAEALKELIGNPSNREISVQKGLARFANGFENRQIVERFRKLLAKLNR